MYHPALPKLVSVFKENIDHNLIGVYLHGSLAMGCYQPNRSDIDLIVIIAEKMSVQEKKKIIYDLIQTEKEEKVQIEMSILLERGLKNFQYPTPYELHYSAFHKTKHLLDPEYLCENGLDPDLAAHLVVTRTRGVVLYGNRIESVFPDINNNYFVDSIVKDIESATTDITQDPIYYSLNLCRVLFYLEKRVVSSKKEGGEWAISQNTPYENWIRECLKAYNNGSQTSRKNEKYLKDFTAYMLQRIQVHLKEFNLPR